MSRPSRIGARLVKRCFDTLVSAVGLAVTWPLIATAAVLTWFEDRANPFYVAERVGRHGRPFRMVKLRTMRVGADRSGVTSTKADDPRITRVGQRLRRWKLDELPQLWNVLKGDMSLVGPRPQVPSGVAMYTLEERRLLTVRPGITDLASVVFADEGDILAGADDPDARYDELIRPTKSRLGLLYVDRHRLRHDIALLRALVENAIDRQRALATVAAVADAMGATSALVAACTRSTPLRPGLPPERADHLDQRPPLHLITERPDLPADPFQLAEAQLRYGLLADVATSADVLEVACGAGLGLSLIASRARTATGVDLSTRNLAVAAREVPGRLIAADAAALPFADASFDVIALLEAVYYLPDIDQFLAEAARVTRPGGRLLCTWPNPARPGFSASPHSHHYPSALELIAQATAAGFDAVRVDGAFPFGAERSSAAADRARRMLAATRLMPKTLRGRARLKRLARRPMTPLRSVDVDAGQTQTLLPVGDGGERCITFVLTAQRAATPNDVSEINEHATLG